MINCLQTRKGTIHIIYWSSISGYHSTFCGKTYSKKNKVETYALDSLIPGMCSKCYEEKERYQQEALKDIRIGYGRIITKSIVKYTHIQNKWGYTPEELYDIYTDRYTTLPSKVRRMKHKAPR